MISFSAMFDQWVPSIQLQDHHRHQLRRAGVILAASVIAANVALVLVVGVVALVGAL